MALHSTRSFPFPELLTPGFDSIWTADSGHMETNFGKIYESFPQGLHNMSYNYIPEADGDLPSFDEPAQISRMGIYTVYQSSEDTYSTSKRLLSTQVKAASV